VSEGFGLANPGKWIAKNGLDQVSDPERDLAIGLDPVAKVFPKLRLEDGGSLAPGWR
jgi:hypothetical protein